MAAGWAGNQQGRELHTVFVIAAVGVVTISGNGRNAIELNVANSTKNRAIGSVPRSIAGKQCFVTIRSVAKVTGIDNFQLHRVIVGIGHSEGIPCRRDQTVFRQTGKSRIDRVATLIVDDHERVTHVERGRCANGQLCSV